MKIIDVVNVYNIIDQAKLTKLSGTDKIALIKIIKVFKPVAVNYEDFSKDAREKLKDEEFESMQEKVQKWQKEGENTTLSIDDRIKINNYFIKYESDITSCLKEETEKEISLEYTHLSEEAFTNLIDSNDFKINEMLLLEELLN